MIRGRRPVSTVGSALTPQSQPSIQGRDICLRAHALISESA
ncbi:hypothetical protein C884_00418 [Kocuria palustris PEL]|uniref:Uncharacterized protein n=1 Tax=Kocuria palustris PEL TaxID=1236550 RepID=M2XBK8_9MICC|nr:hypothetical protein C884_00418 [Kocuria palustris PEL]